MEGRWRPSLGGEAERRVRPCPPALRPSAAGAVSGGWPLRRSLSIESVLDTSFPPLFWSLSAGGGTDFGALPPAVQPLRRLASSVFSSSTLETEHYPHSWRRRPLRFPIQRSRSAESSPCAGTTAPRSLAAGNHRLVPSVLRISWSQLQQVWACFTHKT